MLRLERVAAVGLGLVVIVVVASAAIRLGPDAEAVGVLRAAHRTAASAVVLVVIALAWLAWRLRRDGRAVALAAALVIGLAVIGIVAGRNPPFAPAIANILGGLLLAATFGWLAASSAGKYPPAGALLALLLVQATLGAWLSLAWRESPVALLVCHALLGVALALGTAWLALRMPPSRLRLPLVVLALAVPAAGFAAVFLDRALAPALAHVSVAALLIAAAAAHPRFA